MSINNPQERSESLYRLLAQNLPGMGVILFDYNLRLLIVEGEALAEQGFTKAVMEGRTLFDVLPQTPNRDRLERRYKAALQGQESFDEVVYNNKHYVSHIFPVYGDTGDVEAGMVLVRNITEARLLERELRQNEHHFRGLFDNNNDAVFFIGLDGKITDLNDHAVALLRTTRESQIGRDARANIVVDERELSSWNLQKLLDGEEIPIYERTFKRADGTTFPAEINIALVYDANGEPSHVQSIVRDISERRITEELLEGQVDQLLILLEVDAELTEHLNADYVVTLALDSSMRLSGADNGFIALIDDETGKCTVKHVFGDYPIKEGHVVPHDIGITGRVLRTQRPANVQNVELDQDYVARLPKTQAKMVIPLVSQDRLIGILNLETRYPERFTQSVYDLIRLVTTRIAVSIDNARLYQRSERQLAELQKLYQQVSDLEQLKTDMIRIANHDLRNPLGAIQGYVDLINMDVKESYESGDLERYLEQINDAADLMSKIIRDILSLERVQQSVENMDVAEVDLTSLTLDAYMYQEARAVLHQRSITLNADTRGDHIIVKGNEPFLREALGNLVSNAVKYTPQGGNIEVSLHQEDGVAIFTVVDDGIGIPEDQQDKLFQPFFRASSKETRDIEGTGLGLHLVKQIIERHHGELIFESVYGEGSTFGFKIQVMDQR